MSFLKNVRIKTQVQFRHGLLESQKQTNYHNEFDRLQGAKRITGSQPNVKSRMKGLQQKKQDNH